MAYKEKGSINPYEKFLILGYLSPTIFEGRLVLSKGLKPEWYLRAAGPGFASEFVVRLGTVDSGKCPL